MLTDQRLAEALALLRDESGKHGLLQLNKQIELLEENYSRLLHFFTNGNDDPSRIDQLDALFAQAWQALESLLSDSRQVDEPLSDELTLQMLEEFEQKHEQGEERDKALGRLFLRIRDSLPMTRSIRSALHQLMLDEQLPQYERATLLSAILLNLMQRFDAGMLEHIYTYTLDDQPTQIRTQALVVLALCGMLYDQAISHEPRLRELYSLLVETEGDMLGAIQVTMSYCPSSDNYTHRLGQVLKVELGKLRTGQPTMSFHQFLSLFDSGIDHEYDLFRLQSRHPFFSKPDNAHHWLMPYDAEQHHLQQIATSLTDGDKFIRMMSSSMSQTNASKYSHTLTLAKSMQNVLPQIIDQLKNSNVQMDDLAPLDEYTTLRNYLHDLYRYLTLTSHGKELRNPMRGITDFYAYQCLSEKQEDMDRLEKICDSLYAGCRWDALCPRLSRLTLQRVSPELLDWLAEAAEANHDYHLAQEALLRKMALYSSDEATYSQLANCYGFTHHYVAQENLLHEALKLYPDSVPLLVQMGRCLTNQHRPSEALVVLHHAELLPKAPMSEKVHYELARAYCCLAQHDKAETHITQGLFHSQEDFDLRLLGIITAIADHDVATAKSRFIALSEVLEAGTVYEKTLALTLEVRSSAETKATLTLIHDALRKDKPALEVSPF